ncbi:nicotinamide riboside transporter PnuC [Telluria mixta]|uniref:Nicotinamide riboside transporter PnuC n=1 Tax=Telluria mixta TaxID=34071 RepID=A0ABT2C6J9_9BURK|nr:nicotinamide riboside transporter PnuC [Telluria mixta]MCS0632269.1 nicotinamide riboside transporter PnuC [Telluria mixta]WEM94975.1 nicotinamide riboside transporter PnuC [Telluria mixta]
MIAPLELAANGFVAASILLAGRNNVHTWWTGIVGCTLFGVLFAQNRLYADVALQVFFVATSAVGWWKWLRGDHGDPLPITHASAANLMWTVPLGVVATAAYGALLHFTTNAYAPFLDSAVLVFSIIGQVLMMQRRVENWAFWLLVNSIAAPLYLSRDLVLTAVLYAGFWINAIVSWRSWYRLATQPLLSESTTT